MRFFAILTATLMLPGCAGMLTATPQISLESGDKKMAVKSKVSGVGVVAYSPDGKFLVSGGVQPTVRIWDATNARALRTLPFQTEYGVGDVAYSPDGKYIAAWGLQSLIGGSITKMWEVNDGREIRTFAKDFGGRLSFSPDGKFLLGAGNSVGSLFDVTFKTHLADTQTGQVVRDFDGFTKAAMSPDGRYLLLAGRHNRNSNHPRDANALVMVDARTGQEIWRKSEVFAEAIVFSPDRKHVLVSRTDVSGTFSIDITVSIVSLDVATGNQDREIMRSSVPKAFPPNWNQKISNLVISPNGKLLLSGNTNGDYKLWDIATGALIRQLKRPAETIMGGVSGQAAFSPNGKFLTVASAASLRVFNVESGDEAAAMIAFDDGEWLVTTPSGYYNASDKGDSYLDVSVAGKPYTISQLRESFFRPDLVKVALSGGTLGDYKRIADVKPPPTVAIIETPATTDKPNVTVSLQIQDQGGGIGDVRFYRNGAAVVLEKTRNPAINASSQSSQILRYNISLEPGMNTIRAMAFNADNSMQSTDAVVNVNASISARRPALYAVVVGIKDFVNPRLALTYPVADAELFAAALEAGANNLYSSVYVRRLLKPEETTSVAIVSALKQAQKETGPEDLFVFYVASHGTVDDGQYFLITSNVASTSTTRLKQDALTQEAIKELISNIPASKKLVVLDTCSAGQLCDAIQVAMLTRGMSDDTAMKMLSRAVGSTVLSAATSVQEALEGYKGHGLFTYVIVEGLRGAADANKDGFVKTLELADYVDTQVPAVAETVFKHKQYPIVSPTGQGFPLVRVR